MKARTLKKIEEVEKSSLLIAAVKEDMFSSEFSEDFGL